MTFNSTKQAVDFLASRVIAEATKQSVALSDEDKRLLYFSAVDPRTALGISDSRLNGDDDEFEDKITDLFSSAVENAGTEMPRFAEALEKLKGEDYYILIMASAAMKAEKQGAQPGHRTRDVILYLLISGAVVAVLVVFILLTVK